MKIFLSVLSVVLTLLLTGCQKKSDPIPEPSKTDHITASAWKLEDVGFDSQKDGIIDISGMGAVASCRADNTLSFKTNNTGVTDEGATICNTGDPQTSNFNWSYADAEANINVSNSVLTQINGKSKIVALTSATFTLSRDTTISGLGSGLDSCKTETLK